MTDQKLTLNILENSNSFALESVTQASSNREDLRSWKFAIINIVQAIELVLKELLSREHPVLVFKDVDRPLHTVDLQTAIHRLDGIAKKPLSERDKKIIFEAQKIRNEIIHFKTDLSIEKTRILFSQLFAFLDHLHVIYFKERFFNSLPFELQQFVVSNSALVKELREKAQERIKSEEIYADLVIYCSFCNSPTFVVQDDINECYVCGHEESTEECESCKTYVLESDMKDFSSEFDSDFSEGRLEIHNDYGYRYHRACVDCFDHIVEKINDVRDRNRFRDLEMEEFYRKSEHLKSCISNSKRSD